MRSSGRTWRAAGAASARLSGFDPSGGASRDKCPITRTSPSAVHQPAPVRFSWSGGTRHCLSFIVSRSVCPVLLKGLQELMSSTQTSSGQGSPSSASSLQIRLTRVEESSSAASSSVAALQIPVQIPLQITHLGEQEHERSGRPAGGRCADH